MPNHNPHDLFFKETFSNKEVAKAFIADTFPQEITQGLDFRTLKLANTSYIDSNLKEHYADLVYTCKFRKTKLIVSFLLEHKSNKPKYPHLQLMRYLLNGWT